MCFDWINEKLKKLTCMDIGITKLCVAAFVLMLAKLWPPMVSLEWYWYGSIFVVTYIYLILRIWEK